MYFYLSPSYLSVFYNKFCNYPTVISLFIFGLFFIFFAETPKRRVETVSAVLFGWGEQVTINDVFELPPKDYCRTLVNLLSLYGTWEDFPSVNALMTFPNAVKLILIFLASSSTFPYAPVFPTFSLPAKSTKYNLPVLALRSSRLFWLIVRMKSIWEREDL